MFSRCVCAAINFRAASGCRSLLSNDLRALEQKPRIGVSSPTAGIFISRDHSGGEPESSPPPEPALRLRFHNPKPGTLEMFRRIVLVSATLSALASCTATEQGTAIGAGTGAVIGGAVSNSWGGAAVGAVAGGLAGALIGQSTERRGYCVYRDRYGRTYEARCR